MSSPKLNVLILNGLKTIGDYEGALSFIEEGLTSMEYEDIKGFFLWLQDNKLTVGHGNIDERWAAYFAYCKRSGRKTADQEYIVALGEIHRLLSVVNTKVEMHHRGQEKDKFNWSYVGDLIALKNSLVEIESQVENYGESK